MDCHDARDQLLDYQHGRLAPALAAALRRHLDDCFDCAHADLHLSLGQGTLDIPAALGAVKRSGYDGPITLEVFSEDDHYLVYSRNRLREIWDSL